MKKFILFISFFLLTFVNIAQEPLSEKDKTSIEKLLFAQENAWNEGNIDKFMQTYWKSEKLVFIGSSGVTYGWDAVCENYKKNYPDKANMGELKFTIVELYRIDKNTAFLIGKFRLKRTVGDLNGAFSLVLKKINSHWLIISDHSSAEN